MPEQLVLELRRILDGDERHPGLTPWDFEADLPLPLPEGYEFDYHPASKTLFVRLPGGEGVLRFRWDGYRWEEEEGFVGEGSDLDDAVAGLLHAVARLEKRLARLEARLEELCQSRDRSGSASSPSPTEARGESGRT